MTTIQDLVERAQRAQENSVAGTLADVGPILRALEATSHPLARAWSAALRSELWLIEPRYGARAPEAWLADFVDGPLLARIGAMVAVSNGARRAMLGFDTDALSLLETLGRELAPGLPQPALLASELVSAWASLGKGDATSARDRADDVVKRAGKAEVAAAMVEAQAIRALAATSLSDSDAALDLARRASLVARSEGLPQLEFFAHLALARARRYARQPHLSLRILDSLTPLVTKPWRAWVAWESLLSGGTIDAARLADAPESFSRSAVVSLSECMTRAKLGERDRFDAVAAALSESTRGFALVHTEALELIGALDPTPPASTEELADWRSGETVLAPRSIHGLRASTPQEEKSAGAFVLATLGARGVRVLPAGVGLVHSPGLVKVPQSQRAQGRVETLLSVLALAGSDGLDETECFSRTYGFEFAPELHRGVFDVLVHRARATIDGDAQIERMDGRISLRLERSVLIPDPRVSQRTADRVLRVLAERGRASAKDAAGLLGISLRSAQAALAELAENGACDARKDGRNVAYVVEDSIFSEPSRRLVASDLTGLTRLGS